MVGEEVVFQIMDEAAVYAYRFFTFRTFYMEMLCVVILAETVGGAFAFLAYEAGQSSAFDEVVKRSVHRRLGDRVSRFGKSVDYLLGGNASPRGFYVFQNTFSLLGFVF